MTSAPLWERSNNHRDTEDTEKIKVFPGRKTAIVSRPLFVVRSKVKIPFMQLTTDSMVIGLDGNGHQSIPFESIQSCHDNLILQSRISRDQHW